MAYTMEIPGDIIDDIIRTDLEEQCLSMFTPDYDKHETLENKARLLSALMRTLRHYSTQRQWNSFMEKLNEKFFT